MKRSFIWRSSARHVSMVFVCIFKKLRERRSERRKDSSLRRGKNKGLLIEELVLTYIVMTTVKKRKELRVKTQTRIRIMMTVELEIIDARSIQGREDMVNTTMIDKTKAIEAVAEEEEVEGEEVIKITETIKDKIITKVKITMTNRKVASQMRRHSSK